jgi:hypothetical protein
MKQLLAVIVLAVVAIVCGCRGGVSPIARVYNPYDPMSAENLVKTHPALQDACTAIGSCAYLAVECSKIDGKSFWNISVPGASGDEDGAYVSGGGDTLEEAAKRFSASLRSRRAQEAYEQARPKKEHTIAPCDANCGDAK